MKIWQYRSAYQQWEPAGGDAAPDATADEICCLLGLQGDPFEETTPQHGLRCFTGLSAGTDSFVSSVGAPAPDEPQTTTYCLSDVEPTFTPGQP